MDQGQRQTARSMSQRNPRWLARPGSGRRRRWLRTHRRGRCDLPGVAALPRRRALPLPHTRPAPHRIANADAGVDRAVVLGQLPTAADLTGIALVIVGVTVHQPGPAPHAASGPSPPVASKRMRALFTLCSAASLDWGIPGIKATLRSTKMAGSITPEHLCNGPQCRRASPAGHVPRKGRLTTPAARARSHRARRCRGSASASSRAEGRAETRRSRPRTSWLPHMPN